MFDDSHQQIKSEGNLAPPSIRKTLIVVVTIAPVANSLHKQLNMLVGLKSDARCSNTGAAQQTMRGARLSRTFPVEWVVG